MVRARGLEPPILAEPDPKSGVSANSTTRAASANAGSLLRTMDTRKSPSTASSRLGSRKDQGKYAFNLDEL
jgi:hypothetical protein